MGILLIFLALRTRHEKSYLFLGICLVHLSLLAYIDNWIIPKLESIEYVLYWQRIFHILACLFVPFFMFYLLSFNKWLHYKMVSIYLFIVISLGILFSTDLMLFIENGKIVASNLHKFIFPIFSFSVLLSISHIIFVSIKKAIPENKRLLQFHFVATIALFVLGFIEVFVAAKSNYTQAYRLISSGAILFAITAGIIFIERFFILIKDRQAAYDKLESAYKLMEEASALKEIGQSTAIFNHEIKNLIFIIDGNVQLVDQLENLSPQGKHRIKEVLETVIRIKDLSQNILDFSRSKVSVNKHALAICPLISKCIARYFAEHKTRFQLIEPDESLQVHGDWTKLEQAFINLFKNAIEAEAETITIRFSTNPSILVISIEDDGIGCTPEQIPKLFKAFFTTKQGEKGTGLGMSIIKAIVESHGGQINAYTKNSHPGEHGLIITISFPLYGELPTVQDTEDIILIREGIENFEKVIKTFQNVHINPKIVDTMGELNTRKMDLQNVTIIAAVDTSMEIPKRIKRYRKLSALTNHKDTCYILDNDSSPSPQIFSEEYIVSHLLTNTPIPQIQSKQEFV